MTRLSRFLSALLCVLLAACAARVTDTKEAAPPRSEDARREEPVPAASPVSGEGETAGTRAGAEAPKGGLSPQPADLVIDWDRVRRHAGVDADRGVNVKRHDDTGGILVTPDAPTPTPAPSPAEGAGTPH